MLTFEDCLGLCELTEEEVLAIAAHEHIPEMVALEAGNYLVQTPAGKVVVKEMIRKDIASAAASGDRVRAATLKMLLRDYILKHPCCESRRRSAVHARERRSAA